MTWFLLTITASIFASFYMELNRHLKMNGMQLNFWRLLVQVVVLGPVFISLFSWPNTPHFYILGAVGGVSIAVIDSYLWTISSRHNGRVASMSGPLQAVFAFSFWFLFAPQDMVELFNQPLKMTLVLLAMGLILAGFMGMRCNVVAWRIFKAMALIGFVYGILFIARKLVIPTGEGALIEVAQMFVLHYMVALITIAAMMAAKFDRTVFKPRKKSIKGASVMAGSIFVSMVCLNFAVILSPNPGYPPAVYLVSPLWLLIYHRFVGIRDDASPIAGSVVVVGVIILLLATA